MMAMKIKPCAVIINDIHYSLNTLALADNAMRQAVNKANELDVRLIIAGDMHDSKANLRGECVNAILETIKLCKYKPYVLCGNHSRINEKSREHSLNFLENYSILIDDMAQDDINCNYPSTVYFIAYQHDPDECRKKLKVIPKGSTVIMHQGVNKAASGEYIQDRSAITTDDAAGLRVISGHYHTRQQIDLPNDGVWDYTGNCYTLNYAEASDPKKGYNILMSDGSLEFVSTNLRNHVVIEIEAGKQGLTANSVSEEDLLWLKVRGTREELSKVNKQLYAHQLNRKSGFKLDLIPTETEEFKAPIKQLTNNELLDSIIDNSQTSDEGKSRIKQMWRGMM